MGTKVKVKKAGPPSPGSAEVTGELGSTGLSRTGSNWGEITEEFLPQLSGKNALRAFREMSHNDPVVWSMLFAARMLLRNVHWRVEGERQDLVEFVDSCLVDMSSTWGDTLSEILSFLVYGFSWHEIVYKRRVGPNETDPSRRSRFSDGRIGWRKLPIRSQDTLVEWEFDAEGGVRAFIQSAPPNYQQVRIPIERSLLFRMGAHKGNPEGQSILRGAYRPWFMKKRLENIEGIGIERDLAGIPVIYRSLEMKAHDAELKKIVRNIRRDEQEGLILPLAFDDRGNKLLTFELLGSPGSRQINISQVIDRYDKRIAMTMMADFILLGQQSVGSFALADSKTALFSTALGAVQSSVAEVMNNFAIPRLLGVNGISVDSPDEMPRMVPGDIESVDLQKLGSFVTALAGAGAPLFPDRDLENYLRGLANLPPKSEEAEVLATVPAAPKGQGEPTQPKPQEED
jgi:hypothetical protein